MLGFYASTLFASSISGTKSSPSSSRPVASSMSTKSSNHCLNQRSKSRSWFQISTPLCRSGNKKPSCSPQRPSCPCPAGLCGPGAALMLARSEDAGAARTNFRARTARRVPGAARRHGAARCAGSDGLSVFLLGQVPAHGTHSLSGWQSGRSTSRAPPNMARATIWDADVLIWAASQIGRRGTSASRPPA